MNVNFLVGKTLGDIKVSGNEEILFVLDNGDEYVMYHEQDCCERVTIEDICGDVYNLVGSEILMAEECVSSEPMPNQIVDEFDNSFTWTFYKFATNKGYVTIRWYGESNGYYSESVSFSATKDAYRY